MTRLKQRSVYGDTWRTIDGHAWAGTRLLTALHCRGMRPAQLARELGIPTERVQAWIVVGLVSSGYSADEVAEHLNVSRTRAEWWLSEGLDKHGWGSGTAIEPSESQLDRIVLLLHFPRKFYYGPELDLIPADAISFRPNGSAWWAGDVTPPPEGYVEGLVDEYGEPL